MAVDVIGWETLTQRLSSQTLDDAEYLTLVERQGAGEPQIARVELELAQSEAEQGWVRPIADQIVEKAEELRALAIDHTSMGGRMHFRINVYAAKGRRLLSVGFSTHERDPYAASDGGAMAHGEPAISGVNAYLSSTFSLAQRSNRESHDQLRETIRDQRARIRDLEGQVSELSDRLARIHREESEQVGATIRAREGRAMFEQFMGNIKDLGTAYILKEAPELAGLDPATLGVLKGVLDDPAVAKSIKDPALQQSLKDPDFRRDFAAVLESIADAARTTQATQAANQPTTPAA